MNNKTRAVPYQLTEKFKVVLHGAAEKYERAWLHVQVHPDNHDVERINVPSATSTVICSAGADNFRSRSTLTSSSRRYVPVMPESAFASTGSGGAADSANADDAVPTDFFFKSPFALEFLSLAG